jgi:hypothetical protein
MLPIPSLTRLWGCIPLRSPSSLRVTRGPASDEWTVGGLELPFSSLSGRSSDPVAHLPLLACLLSHQMYTPDRRLHKLILDDEPVDAMAMVKSSRFTLPSGWIWYKGAMAGSPEQPS